VKEGLVMTTDTANQRLDAWLRMRQRGVEWLKRNLNRDGSIGEPKEGYHFYRVPWAFALAGETAAAAASCAWIRQNMLTADGMIDGPYRVYDDAYAYRDSALVIGAHLLGQYDLSYPVMRHLLSIQDPVSGAFPNDRLPGGQMGDDMDIPYTCGPGFACLATGHLDAARAVRRHLATVYAAQPELPDRLYYTWSRTRQCLVTDFAEERSLWYVVENQAGRFQRWTVGGIAAAFLCRLYLAEPLEEYLDLARRYQDFSMSATDQQFGYVSACKSSWGSSLLYQITGEEKYLEWMYRMGDWYAAQQEKDGRWRPQEPTTNAADVEITAEFVMHVDTLIGALASRA
jgi:hypothetical protein